MRISIGKSRKDTAWKIQDLSWSDLCQQLSSTYRTRETVREYKAMSPEEKTNIKDVGGFVGGTLINGKRLRANMVSRRLVTLDADFAAPNTWETVSLLFDNAMCCYTTHSHTEKAPRLRFVIPLDRDVALDEYEPIARRVAADLGIDMFDVTTYETNRLMYWPSTSKDGEFFFGKIDGDFLSADAMLATYKDWRDTSEWPIGTSEQEVRKKDVKAQGDPTAKNGIIGQFCRTYDIPSAIATFLPEEYEPCQDPTRYTYTKGSTSAGLVLYQEGKFAFSHHSTDPAGGCLCNAFDLVRLHKFGELDANVTKETPITKMPSYKAMVDFAANDAEVKKTIVAENMANARKAFSDDYVEVDDLDWASKLDTNDHGEIKATTENIAVILEHDPNLANNIALNLFKDMPCIVNDLPWHKCKDHDNGDQWSDDDSNALTHYIETTYGIYNQGKLSAALSVVMGRHSFHPIRNYLNSLEWDEIPRAESLFIDYMGAEDNKYTRTVTRKWLTAAVARVMNPGCKFDNLVVLVGPQGIGKSYLGHKLGRGWFSDTFTSVQGKDAYDQLKGCWIIEIAELSAMKRAEVESVKMFISKQEDNYRGAYREYSKVNKRQCVFYGTTNDDSFLHDRTGNRRFWPIAVNKVGPDKVFSLTDDTMNQIWAEAVQWFRDGESLYLDAEVTKLATAEQDKFMTVDPRQGQVEEYLETLLPENWESLTKQQRRDYIQGINFSDNLVGTVKRQMVCIQEVAYELFGEDIKETWEAKAYHNMLTGIPGWAKTGKRPKTLFGRQYVYERTEEC